MPEENVTPSGVNSRIGESFSLFDTVAITTALEDLSISPPGWFGSFAAFGAATDHHFFDIRNKANCQLPYNNQDSFDLSFGFRVRKFAIQFFAPMVANQYLSGAMQADWMEDKHTPMWMSEAPNHCGFELQVNQDVRLKGNCAMINSGVGPVGGGWGQFGLSTGATEIGSPVALSSGSQGTPDLDGPWCFPDTLDIPRRANVAVIITPSEWLRRMIADVWTGPGRYQLRVDETKTNKPTMFGIRVSLHGERLVQPRGQYSA